MHAKKWNVETISRIGMMGAIAALLGFFPEIPMAFFAPWLKLDFAYVPMLLTGFSLGFLPGLIVLVIKNLFQLLTTNSFGVGQIADMIMGLSLLLPASLVYHFRRTRAGALTGMVAGIAAMTAAGVLSNLFLLLPTFLGDGFTAYMESHPTLVWASIIPFNLIKGVSVCLVTYLLYKHLSPFLKRGLK